MKLKQLTFALLMALGLAANAANTKTTVTQVTDGVQLTTDVDYIITNATPFTTTGSVDIQNTEHAVLILSSVKPSKVISSWMSHIYINGVRAVNGTNCQVKMYNRGAIVFPYSSSMKPLTCYTEKNFGGEACTNYSEGHSGGFMKTLTTATLNNQIRSFKLKRGYMVTFAIGTGGWGYSRCFIADQEDLEISTLPAILDQRISSYRIFKWQNAHKASLANDTGYNITQALNVTSCYSFGLGEDRYPDTECVPHHIYEDWPSPSSCGSVTYSCHLKTNNEPGNSADPSPQDVATVLANWENLMRTGMRLCSESSHDGSWSHLQSFISAIDARGWRCDILDLHCYWGAGSFGDFSNYYNNYGGRPIWISEWVWGASWNKSNWSSGGVFVQAPDRDDWDNITFSANNQKVCYDGTKPILEKLNASKYVERYYYWNSEQDGSKIYKGGELSTLGQYYANMNEGMGYNASIQKIPTTPPMADLGTLTSKYNSRSKTVTLTWEDPNGDLMSTISIQRKSLTSSVYKEVGTVTPKDKNSSAGVSYTYTDEVSDPDTYTYRVRAIPYNSTSSSTYKYTNEVTVNVDPAQGIEGFQYGNLRVSTTEDNTVNYTTSFPNASHRLFIGILSNENPSFKVSNVTSNATGRNNFKYRLLPWNTNTANFTSAIEVPFLVLNDGYGKFGDLNYEVGNISANTANKATSNSYTDVTEVTFQQPFPEGVTPVVLTEVVNNTAYANTTSTNKSTALSIRVFDITNTGFKFIIYPEVASGRKISTSLNVNYFAIQPGLDMVDEENGIMIAAGLGSDNKIYESALRENTFRIETEIGGEKTMEAASFYNPVILADLQTNNFPSVTMMRRTNATEKREDKTWVTGIRARRTLEHSFTGEDGKEISIGTTDEKYRDELGWVVIATATEGGTVPTAITDLTATSSGNGKLRVRTVDGRIYVDGAATFEVYTASGAQVSATSVLTPGIYVVRANGKSAKVLVK